MKYCNIVKPENSEKKIKKTGEDGCRRLAG